MTLDLAIEAQARELFAGLGELRVKRMFGGAGVYAGELFFALLSPDAIWIKGDDETEPAFRAAGSEPFRWTSDKGEMTMRYWRLPESALDDPEEAARWGRLGLGAALRARAGKAAPKKRTGKKAPRLLIDGPWDEEPDEGDPV